MIELKSLFKLALIKAIKYFRKEFLMTIDKKSLINWVGGKRLLRKTIERWRLDFVLQRQMGRLGNL